MTAYNSSMSKYKARQRQLEMSMLEYSGRMSSIQAVRHNPSYREKSQHERQDSLEICAQRPNAYRSTYVRSTTTNAVHPVERHYDSHHSSRWVRRDKRRPLSFDEKELQRNKAGADWRPRRDTKSERPIVVPSGLPPIHDPPPNTPEGTKRNVRVNLVSASDLYDLVDVSLQSKVTRGGGQGRARVANPQDGVRLVEELDLRLRGKPEKDKNPLGFHSQTITMHDKSELVGGHKPRHNFSQNARKRNVLGRNDHKDETRYSHYENELQSSRQSNNAEKEELFPLSIFLGNAAWHLKSEEKLRNRPKRAKRMQLHKPDLLVIPEDGGTFIRHDNSSDLHRKEANSLSTVPFPSNTSLAAIKDITSKSKKGRSHQRPNWYAENDGYSHDDENANSYRKLHRKKEKIDPGHNILSTSRNEIEDDVMMTSIYPLLPWETDGGHDLKITHGLENSHKEKAQKKMKRLIFLRDQPEQYYKREM